MMNDLNSKIDNLDGLSQIEKQQAKNALEYLSKVLGYNISEIIKSKHPITKYIFINQVPWSWKWLISLVEAIQAVSNQTNGSKIIRMLKNPSLFASIPV